jgi:hypothetical protein
MVSKLAAVTKAASETDTEGIFTGNLFRSLHNADALQRLQILGHEAERNRTKFSR